MHFLRAWLKICDFEYGNHRCELNAVSHPNMSLHVERKMEKKFFFFKLEIMAETAVFFTFVIILTSDIEVHY